MKAKDFLENVCSNIKYKPASKQISEELRTHIEEAKVEIIGKGYSEEEAEEIAVKKMGNAKEIGKKLNKIHRPKLDLGILITAIVFSILDGWPSIFLGIDVLWNKLYLGINNFMTAKMIYIISISTMILAICLYFFDYRKIYKYSKIMYMLAIILNIASCIRGERYNGNIIWGLEPFTNVSATVFSVPLYIIAFSGLVQDYIQDKKDNYFKLILLSILSVILSLIINFVSGLVLAIVYMMISIVLLAKKSKYKRIISVYSCSIIGVFLLTTIICVIPTKIINKQEKLESSYWLGIDTMQKEKIEITRQEVIQNSKLFGSAEIEFNPENIYAFSKCIFLSVLSKYGWVTSIIFIIIIIGFEIKILIDAINIKDNYGKTIMLGISILYLTQTLGNIAMNFGFGVIAEFSLPFIRGGMTENLMNIICLSLMLSIYRRKDINFEEPQKSKILTKIENYFFEEC